MESPNLQQKIATRFAEQADKIAKQMAFKIGTPSDSQDISQEEEVRLWNDSPHGKDKDSITEASRKLLSQNMPVDQIVDNIFPNRRKMMMQGRPNPTEWVQFAEKMKTLTESGEYDNAALPDIGPVQGLSTNPY